MGRREGTLNNSCRKRSSRFDPVRAIKMLHLFMDLPAFSMPRVGLKVESGQELDFGDPSLLCDHPVRVGLVIGLKCNAAVKTCHGRCGLMPTN